MPSASGSPCWSILLFISFFNWDHSKKIMSSHALTSHINWLVISYDSDSYSSYTIRMVLLDDLLLVISVSWTILPSHRVPANLVRWVNTTMASVWSTKTQLQQSCFITMISYVCQACRIRDVSKLDHVIAVVLFFSPSNFSFLSSHTYKLWYHGDFVTVPEKVWQ